jgi:hypothetical protein
VNIIRLDGARSINLINIYVAADAKSTFIY